MTENLYFTNYVTLETSWESPCLVSRAVLPRGPSSSQTSILETLVTNLQFDLCKQMFLSSSSAIKIQKQFLTSVPGN